MSNEQAEMIDVLREEVADLAAQLKIAQAAVARKYWRDDGNPLPTDAQGQAIRITAMEEAARLADEESPYKLAIGDGFASKRLVPRAALGAAIRALAPLPSTLVVVERETIENVKEALMLAAHSMCWDAIDEPVRAALALLEKVK